MSREEFYNELIIPLSQRSFRTPNEMKIMLISNHPKYIFEQLYEHYLTLMEHCQNEDAGITLDLAARSTNEVTITITDNKTMHKCNLMYFIREEMVRNFKGMRVDMSYITNEYWEMRLIIGNIHKVLNRLCEYDE